MEIDVTKVLPRSEIPEEFTWNLKDIFASDDAWMAEYEALKTEAGKFEAWAGKLSDPEKLLEFLRFDDEITVRFSKLMGYANQKLDQDTANSFYADFKGKAVSVYALIGRGEAFAAPEIIGIDEAVYKDFFTRVPELEEYRRSLYVLRRKKTHTLSPAEERLLAAASEISEGPETIGGALRNADLTFGEVTDANGEKHELTSGSFVPLLESSDRVLRKNAFEAYYDKMDSVKNTVAATLDAQFKMLKFFAEARHYPTTIEAALDATEVPVPIYTNLIEAVHGNMDKMYRYVALRKKLLGVEELHMYDVYTPVIDNVAVKIPFAQAKETVLEALQVLGQSYVGILKEGFANRWIDVYENKSKRSGAYSSGNSWPHPYVLLNHKDTLDSMFTLAHEMGHALHSYHSAKNQPVSCTDYVIFVAEVASTVNEVLLMRHLLAKTADKKQRAYLINHFLDQFKGTVYRQTMFAEFELAMGRMTESGETLTAEALSKKYHELNKLYFGEDMVSDDRIALEWTRIPHFFYNYYVFQYATGFSAAVAIANRILEEGENAVQDYIRFLSGGGSTDPVSLLKIAGVDMSTPDPVNSALKLFGELVDELDGIMSE